MGTPVAGKAKTSAPTKVLLLLALHAALLHGAGGVIKCGKAVGMEPEPCPDETFKCCRYNACSKVCTGNEGPRLNDKCTPSSQRKCCVNGFSDGFVRLPIVVDCPKKRDPISCPREVAEEPQRNTCSKQNGECCKWARTGYSWCARYSICNAPNVCKPSADQKCCLGKHGMTVTAVAKESNCSIPRPICPIEHGESSEECNTGCCVFDYDSKIFSCAAAGADGKCPAAARNEQTCNAAVGLPCCAHQDGGFKPEEAGNCSSPIIKCGKAVGKEPKPCANGTFKCCVHNSCSTSCQFKFPEGPGKDEKCTPGITVNDKVIMKCCVKEFNDGYVRLPMGTECPKERAPLRCPLEVALEPKNQKCRGVHGECCILYGAGKTTCARGKRCEAEGVCRPDPDQKCCLNAQGTAVEAVARAIQCDKGDNGDKEDHEAEDKENHEAEDKEDHEGYKGAGDAHGPGLLLTPATLLLLLPH